MHLDVGSRVWAVDDKLILVLTQSCQQIILRHGCILGSISQIGADVFDGCTFGLSKLAHAKIHAQNHQGAAEIVFT